MEALQFQLQFWPYLLLFGTALVVALTVPKLSGKGLLIGFLVIRMVVEANNYVLDTLLRNNTITSLQYQTVIGPWSNAVNMLLVAGYVSLVLFVLALKSGANGQPMMSRFLFSFNGRVRRQFYWTVSLALLGGNAYALATMWKTPGNRPNEVGIVLTLACLLLWFVVSTWISLATQVKRWHDRDKSGWWVLIGLIPIVGGIWFLIETGFMEGTSGNNQFGPVPGQHRPASDTYAH